MKKLFLRYFSKPFYIMYQILFKSYEYYLDKLYRSKFDIADTFFVGSVHIECQEDRGRVENLFRRTFAHF